MGEGREVPQGIWKRGEESQLTECDRSVRV